MLLRYQSEISRVAALGRDGEAQLALAIVAGGNSLRRTLVFAAAGADVDTVFAEYRAF